MRVSGVAAARLPEGVGHPALRQQAPLLLAFATVYFVWGSTYLAIAVAVETLPPFLMVGVRMLAAGSVLYGFARLRGAEALTRGEWRFAFSNGALLFLGGYGLVAWAEQRVPSGAVALLAATAPLWLVLMQWIGGEGRPRLRTWAALVLGTGGVALLITDGAAIGSGGGLRALAVLLGSVGWAAGTLRASRQRTRGSAARSAGSDMLAGGWLLVVAGVLLGEAGAVDAAAFTVKSLLALGYLIVFGSIAAFTAYRWLLQRVSPSLVATHAYVNPLVALVLGWAILAEPFGPRVIVASIAIVGAVALMRRRERTDATARSRGGMPARVTATWRATSAPRSSVNLAGVVSTRVESRACPADGPHSTA